MTPPRIPRPWLIRRNTEPGDPWPWRVYRYTEDTYELVATFNCPPWSVPDEREFVRKPRRVPTDEATELYVTGLIGAGFCFSQPEDYDMARQWAIRAYLAGLAGHTLDDVIAEARGGAPCGD